MPACSIIPEPKATPLPSKHVRALIAPLISRYLIVPTLSHVSLHLHLATVNITTTINSIHDTRR
jgi:hypothetical protein